MRNERRWDANYFLCVDGEMLCGPRYVEELWGRGWENQRAEAAAAAAWTVSDCSGKQTMIDPQRVSLIKRTKFKEA